VNEVDINIIWQGRGVREMFLWISKEEPVLTGVTDSRPGRFSINFLHSRGISRTLSTDDQNEL